MIFLSEYLLFIAKSLTVFVLATGLIIVFFGLLSKRKKHNDDDSLEISYLNSLIADDKIDLEYDLLDKKQKKQLKKNPVIPQKDKPRLFVIDFDGDINASEVSTLRRQITAIISTANKQTDQVLLRLESPGGMVHSYGLASSQLNRLKNSNINLIVAVDKVAASGGYMMACVANKIVAAPFAVLGSIGVVAQIPNFNRVLKDKNIDFELHTAGKYKRTLTMFGENDDEARQKFQEELDLTHDLFKDHIHHHRPQIDIELVATGETWYGQQAIANHLADEILTSDDYILTATQTMDVYKIDIERKSTIIDKLKDSFFSKAKANIEQRYFL